MHWMCGRPLHCWPNKAHCIRLRNYKEKEGKKGLTSSQNTGLWPFAMTVFSNLTVQINLAIILHVLVAYTLSSLWNYTYHSRFPFRDLISDLYIYILLYIYTVTVSQYIYILWPYTVNWKELSCAAETAVIQYFLLRKKKLKKARQL